MTHPSPDRHARDFAAWERQLAAGRRAHGRRGRIVLYVLVFGFVGLCGACLAAAGDRELGIAVLVLAGLIGALWFTDTRG